MAKLGIMPVELEDIVKPLPDGFEQMSVLSRGTIIHNMTEEVFETIRQEIISRGLDYRLYVGHAGHYHKDNCIVFNPSAGLQFKTPEEAKRKGSLWV